MLSAVLDLDLYSSSSTSTELVELYISRSRANIDELRTLLMPSASELIVKLLACGCRTINNGHTDININDDTILNDECIMNNRMSRASAVRTTVSEHIKIILTAAVEGCYTAVNNSHVRCEDNNCDNNLDTVNITASSSSSTNPHPHRDIQSFDDVISLAAATADTETTDDNDTVSNDDVNPLKTNTIHYKYNTTATDTTTGTYSIPSSISNRPPHAMGYSGGIRAGLQSMREFVDTTFSGREGTKKEERGIVVTNSTRDSRRHHRY